MSRRRVTMSSKVGRATDDLPVNELEERPSKRPRRSLVACLRCHSHKVKCSGGNPCHNCSQQDGNVECTYPMRDRKILIQESYLNQLKQENDALRQGRRLSGQDVDKTEPPEQYLESKNLREEDENQENATSNADVDLRNPLIEDKAWFVPDNNSRQPIYIGEAACTAFGTRLRQFLKGNEPVVALSRSKYTKDKSFLRMPDPIFQLPNRAYANLLLKVALRFLGNDYHLMLRKSTMERMEALYRHQSYDDPVFLCKLFALFSMGEMYANRRLPSTKGPDIPGTGFFVQAMSLFQDMHEEASVMYVEALLIISLFSLALNRTKSAYTYAGMALRLCLTLGLHHNLPEGYAISTVEREHRIRVWWSVYITDRITSSKLGHPVTVRDSDIDVDLPSMDNLTPFEKEEFSDPSHLIAHVKLARITGDIIGDIYGREGQAKAFVQSVQKILRSLRSWAETLPQSVQISPGKPPQKYAARHVASLHLCFNQCVILTTRPILFHVFKSRFQPQGPAAVSPTTMALSEACIHAARSSNSLLTQLWIDGGMAIFGYFDSHYLFSSTIILMMSSILGTTNSDADREAVDTASDIMQSMVQDGNLPAAGFHPHFLEIRKGLLEFIEHGGHHQGVGAAMATTIGDQDPLPEELRLNPTTTHMNDSSSAFLVQSALDDPSIQNFLTQADTQWGFPAGMEMAGDMTLTAPWLFE
ncbi:putative C6 transcription factor [Talaromyces proteolyticus]|uniref:C6 transcription factor n=1 Tax=Talaromyces proteolyticus TaxID=1131652 RepID=A0AAD4Q4S2_9EURO|nr:putative C6 transcription factor [Talaromyces proteolyticus]KAH8703566.1 putative C6 transcription factor [Talaromyces proteolyticus]